MADDTVLPLITRYRPKSFDEVIGHDRQITRLQAQLQEPGHAHTYLLSGPSGVGKTTIARIIAREVGGYITEIHGAVDTSVEGVRQIERLSTNTLWGPPWFWIIDECHRLSQNAKDALLKPLEEPKSSYLVLCTTAPDKLDKTIINRCYCLDLGPLKNVEVRAIIDSICQNEGWSVANEVLKYITSRAEGSARQAINYLNVCREAATVAEAKELITGPSSPPAPDNPTQQLQKRTRNWRRKQIKRL